MLAPRGETFLPLAIRVHSPPWKKRSAVRAVRRASGVTAPADRAPMLSSRQRFA